MSYIPGHIPVQKINPILRKLRQFFYNNGYQESVPQGRRHILPSCEDYRNITTYMIGGVLLPQIQTGQMGLEDDLLENLDLDKVFCLTTSYRDEPNPKPRHDLTFPMFEFESIGNYEDLLATIRRMLRFLGYEGSIVEIDYLDACARYQVEELEHEHEEMLCKDFGDVVFLKHFPMSTHPFWNMKLHEDGKLAYKLDVIMGGIETIGSAERECDHQKMRDRFYTVSDGKYAEKLFDLFGVERVEAELNKFLEHNFVPRFGAGIGLTRLIKFFDKYNAQKEI